LTTPHDITGLGKCRNGKTNIDLTDKELFAILETEISKPAADFLREHRRGEAMHIPATVDKRAMVRDVDDGTRTVEEVARLCGCSISTVKRVRHDASQPG